MELFKSAAIFLGGTLKRAQWYLPPLLLDPFDIAGRLLKVNYQPPQWLAWSLFGLGWFIAILLTYHDLRKTKVNLERQLDQRENKRKTREALGLFMEGGRELQHKCANEKVPPPNDEANKWANEVEQFLTKELDGSYVNRFRSTASIPMVANSISSIPHRNLWAGIHTRIYQLAKFIEQLGN